MLGTESMVTGWLPALLWGMGSVVWVEWVRDFYHALAHHWPALYRLHGWHHRAFRPDLTIVDPQIYRRSQWVNDVPECLVMLMASLLLWWGLAHWGLAHHWLSLGGTIYTLFFLAGAIARGSGWQWAHDATDLTHLPGPFLAPPTDWRVNRTYHWRHHFDNTQAYYSGTFSLFDKVMGTALSLKGKTVAVTGASGALGRSLLVALKAAGAKPLALTRTPQDLTVEHQPCKTTDWTNLSDEELGSLFKTVDILILNHGINPHGDRSNTAISTAYEVNTFSHLRLLDLFLSTVISNREIAQKEVWVNTSEAEVNPAFSPLYELSKRTLGDLITLKRLDAPCVIRKLILGPFRSNLNPVGVMSAPWVARQIVALARRDVRNVVVTINPLTYLLFPLKEMSLSLYFRLFTRRTTSPHQIPR